MSLSAQEREEYARTWGAVLLRSQQDDGYAARLRADPRSVLTEAGMPVRPDAEIIIEAVDLADGPDLDRQIELYAAGRAGGSYRFLVPITRLEIQELTEQELEGVAAGGCVVAFVTPPVSGT